ncbi:hypothetical protein ACFSCV_00875 [Methylopila henanensis]|uniref:Lectin-like protein BA14k n=1 Tax=Methylopila henanensis TaxID=873516 RepID=A0ABW4K0E0_9HYPH
MTSFIKLGLAGACAFGMAFGSLPAQAAWVGSAAAVQTAKTSSIETVGWRERRGYYRGGGRHYHYHRHRRGGGNAAGYAAAGILGLAAGAAIAGSASRDRYYDEGPRRVYVEEPRRYRQCRVTRWGENRYGDPVRVTSYRPC